jgi:hypothetical protein
MADLIFTDAYGPEDKQVKISDLFGSTGGSGGYHVYIDNFFIGQMFYRKGEWVGFLSEKYGFTMDDIQVLGQIIEREF